MGRHLQFLAGKRFGMILEPASGPGSFTEQVLANVTAFDRYVAIDSSERAAKGFAEAITNPKVEFIQGDALHELAAFTDVDLAVLSNSMHHFPDPREILEKLRLTLGPEGLLVVNEMYADIDRPGQLLQLDLHALAAEIDTAGGTYHGRPRTRSEQVADLEAAGFRILEEDEMSNEDEEFLEDDYEESLIRLFGVLESRIEALEPEKRGDFGGRLAEVKDRCQTTRLEAPPQLARLCAPLEPRAES